MLITLNINEDDLFDSLEPRIKKLLDLHLDTIVTEAIEQGMKDMDTLIASRIEEGLKKSTRSYTMEELESALKQENEQ